MGSTLQAGRGGQTSLTARTGAFRGDDGATYVGGTRRADGTFRKAVRVKEGYVPPDEQKTFRSRRQQVSACDRLTPDIGGPTAQS